MNHYHYINKKNENRLIKSKFKDISWLQKQYHVLLI